MSESHPPPVAGQDYPETWSQFMDWFHSEQACLDYLERLSWPKEFICPKCGVVGISIKTSRNRLAALIQRWLLGTHQGAVQPAKLDHYLDEFVFRFNRRKSSSRGMLFYRLLEQAVVTSPVTYK